jgi:putative ATP-dependent endonuclease of OLD family
VKIKSIAFKNFRCLADIAVELDDVTVIIGENNTGKTALLDGLRFVTSRAPQRRQVPIAEYDFHMPDPDSDPKLSDPIVIDVALSESKTGEWPAEVVQALQDIVQLDPIEDLHSIYMRCVNQYNDKTKIFESGWQFLSITGDVLTGKAANPAYVATFLKYIPYFYLSALRNVDEEFSPRSQFWGKILRSVEIPEVKRKQIVADLEKLNTELLGLDPRLNQVASTVGRISSVMSGSSGQDVSIRALPLKPWDLMSKSEIVLKAKSDGAQFPIGRYGQGTQSLSVLFLFQAFVEHLLKDTFEQESEPILALEEPEAHLHPQAARALWNRISELPGQRIVSSHSPYFVQNVPFRKLRVLRRQGVGVRVHWLPSTYFVAVPKNPELEKFIAKYSSKYKYQDFAGLLFVAGNIPKSEYQELLLCYTTPADRAAVHPFLKTLKESARFYLSDQALAELQSAVRRMRGEILFSRGWLLCEGQSEYVLLHHFATMLGQPLDAAGISIIDFQNSGSAPANFAILARALGFPWVLACDGDPAGNDYVQAVKEAFQPDDVSNQCHQLPATDLEAFLVTAGFATELEAIVQSLGRTLNNAAGTPGYEPELAELLRKEKGDWPRMLVDELIRTNASAIRVPPYFSKVIQDIQNAAT